MEMIECCLQERFEGRKASLRELAKVLEVFQQKCATYDLIGVGERDLDFSSSR